MQDAQLPDMQFPFERYARSLLHAMANMIDELEDIVRRRSRVSDDIIGVPLAQFGPADTGLGQPGPIDQRRRRFAGRVME